MKKTFKLEDLDCANCAAKMETAINKLEGVQKATVSFMTQKLTLDYRRRGAGRRRRRTACGRRLESAGFCRPLSDHRL